MRRAGGNFQDFQLGQGLTYDVWHRILSDSNPGFQPFCFAEGLWKGAREFDSYVHSAVVA
jgi:hypothetical protein